MVQQFLPNTSLHALGLSNSVIFTIMIGASLSEPHTSESFMLLIIHKKLRIKIRELMNTSVCIITTSIFARVMVKLMA